MTTNSVWVIISCDAAVDKLRDLIDKGYFAESQSILYELKSLCEKVQKLVEAKGGSLLLNAYERIVFEVPITVAEEMPNIVEGYKQFFGTKIACGIGLTFTEAASAAHKSVYTNNIELFDPKDPSFHEGSAFYKSYDDIEYNLPPNLFDPKSPPNNPNAPQDDDYIGLPSAEEQLQAENQMIQAVVAQIGGQQIQEMQQQMQQQQQGSAGGDEGPRDLMEALHGEQIPGREKDLNENEGGNPEGGAEEDEDEGGESKESKGSSKESESDDEDEGDEDHNAKLGNLLATVKQHMPQIMQLAESNPAAYKQAMNMMNKLLEYAKKSKKKTKKSDLFELTDELNKAIRLHLPVGTIKGKRKKVKVDGKEVWRSVSAGQVEDNKGNAISVRVANAQTKENGKN